MAAQTCRVCGSPVTAAAAASNRYQLTSTRPYDRAQANIFCLKFCMLKLLNGNWRKTWSPITMEQGPLSLLLVLQQGIVYNVHCHCVYTFTTAYSNAFFYIYSCVIYSNSLFSSTLTTMGSIFGGQNVMILVVPRSIFVIYFHLVCTAMRYRTSTSLVTAVHTAIRESGMCWAHTNTDNELILRDPN